MSRGPKIDWDLAVRRTVPATLYAFSSRYVRMLPQLCAYCIDVLSLTNYISVKPVVPRKQWTLTIEAPEHALKYARAIDSFNESLALK